MSCWANNIYYVNLLFLQISLSAVCIQAKVLSQHQYNVWPEDTPTLLTEASSSAKSFKCFPLFFRKCKTFYRFRAVEVCLKRNVGVGVKCARQRCGANGEKAVFMSQTYHENNHSCYSFLPLPVGWEKKNIFVETFFLLNKHFSGCFYINLMKLLRVVVARLGNFSLPLQFSVDKTLTRSEKVSLKVFERVRNEIRLRVLEVMVNNQKSL